MGGGLTMGRDCHYATTRAHCVWLEGVATAPAVTAVAVAATVTLVATAIVIVIEVEIGEISIGEFGSICIRNIQNMLLYTR